MRNRITLIISLVSIILLAIVTIYGIEIGNFKILSISQIIEKNDSVNEKISEASKLTSVDYPERIEALNKTFDSYTIQKQKYQDLAGVSEGKSEEIYETKQYDISYLWRVLGKYATNRGLTLGIDVQKSTNNLYNFKMSGSGTTITATFKVEDINIDPSTIAGAQTEITSDEEGKQLSNTINIFNK